MPRSAYVPCATAFDRGLDAFDRCVEENLGGGAHHDAPSMATPVPALPAAGASLLRSASGFRPSSNERPRLVTFTLRVPLNAVVAAAVEREVASHEQTGPLDDRPPKVRAAAAADPDGPGEAPA